MESTSTVSPTSSPTTFNDKKGANINAESQQVVTENGEEVDAVWGKLDDKSPNYRNLSWIRAAIIMIKSQIGLGILGLPLVMDNVGLVPGIIIILVIAVITTWADYIIGVFKRRHPDVYTLADVGYHMAGSIGREAVFFFYWLLMTAIAGAGFVGVATALNAVSLHGTCTIVFVVVAAVATAIVSSLRTLDRISWVGWVGLVSILAAVITLAASVGVQDRPANAPQVGPWTKEVNAFSSTSFVQAMNAVNTVVFAYAGGPTFISIVGEMKQQRDYTKSVVTCQAFVTAVYLIIGCVVYHYVGQYIASPALGSAGPLMKRVSYGIAIPGLLVGCIIYTHLPAKGIFVRILRGSKHLSTPTWQHWTIWLSCVIGNCAISFIIAEAIPFFGDLLSLIGALLGTFICIILEGYMWIWLYRDAERTTRWKAMVAMNSFMMLLGFYIMVAGTYAACVTINQSLKSGNTTSPFSCADNSNSV